MPYYNELMKLLLPITPQVVFPLTKDDFALAADSLGCDTASVQAVSFVESSGKGFFSSGYPVMLFEAHVFSKLTRHIYDNSHPTISSRTWNKSLYTRGEHEYERLALAMTLAKELAWRSASWGQFQILGINYEACGCDSITVFIEKTFRSSMDQLTLFVNFLLRYGINKPLKVHDWKEFARRYNGPGYAQNFYAEKLDSAYKRFSK
jgi:hypothetical protein